MLAAAATAVGTSFALGPDLLLLAPWSLLFAVCYVFYEQRPQPPPSPNALLSPLAGRVERVDECWDPWSNRMSIRIRVRTQGAGVGTVWAPTEGKLEDFNTKAAEFDGPAGQPVADDSPNCYAVLIRTDEQQDARVCASSRLPISRFKLDFGPGSRVGQGRRLGFAYFVSYVDLLLATDASIEVKAGQRVIGGESVLAQFGPRDTTELAVSPGGPSSL